jgi:uncharacterized membrane protein
MFTEIVEKLTKVRYSSQVISTGKLPGTGFRILIIVVLLLGIFFRFHNLDRKVYWHDETFTSLRISGYTSKELIQQVFNGRVIDSEDLQKYQRTNSEKSFSDTIKSLAVEDPQHPPLYYAIARGWVQMFGNSVAVTRSLSAFISLLVFPCVYWLCWELFETPLVGWVAMALVAVSPFQLIYAQEAREYILWAVTTLLSSAALLRAVRLKNKRSWGLYAITFALGLYTFLFTGLVAIGHGIYVFTMERFRFSKTTISYLLASLVGFVAFLPWVLILVNNFSKFYKKTAWTAQIDMPFGDTLKVWILQISYIFIDFEFSINRSLFKYLSLPIVLALLGASIYLICHKTPKRIWLFILTLIGSTAIPLMLPDLMYGGIRSVTHRYLIPYFLGIQLAVAYLLATKLSSVSFSKRQIWQTIVAVAISSGILSCSFNVQAETWWNKFFTNNFVKIAHILNESNRPLLITNLDPGVLNIGNMLSLSYLVQPKVRFQLFNEPNLPKISVAAGDVFLFNPSKTLRAEAEQQYKAKTQRVFQDKATNMVMWKLSKTKS